jgi:starch phosphorylase
LATIIRCWPISAATLTVRTKVDELYRNPEEWTMKAMHNIANMGYFSSDRTIQEYAEQIWHIDPVRL